MLDLTKADGDARKYHKRSIRDIIVSAVRVYLFLPRVSCRRGQGEGAVGKDKLVTRE